MYFFNDFAFTDDLIELDYLAVLSIDEPSEGVDDFWISNFNWKCMLYFDSNICQIHE